MLHAIFLRAVNVGGHKLKPKELADSLKFRNIGAAGTYVSTRKLDSASLERTIKKQIPFETEVFIWEAEEVFSLVRSAPFGTDEGPENEKRCVTLLHRPPVLKPQLPIEKPTGDKWECRVFLVTGRYALSVYRRLSDEVPYPNALVEKHFKVPATTRGWDTMLKVAKVLEES